VLYGQKLAAPALMRICLNIVSQAFFEIEMTINQEDREEFNQEFLENIPDKFAITEKEIDLNIQNEYYKDLSKINVGEYVEDDALREGEKLFDPTVASVEKKKIIAILSQMGTVKTYRMIERHVEQSEGELGNWSRVGLRHCQMLLESSLSDKNVGLISAGLGGKENMLRYVVVVGFLKPDLHSEQKRIIEESFQYICSHNSSKTEAFDFKSSYIKVSLLVSMDIAVGSVIEESIQLVNEKISCLYDGYFVTNVNQPTEKDIQNYLTTLWKKG
jgi:hypothetical protein